MGVARIHRTSVRDLVESVERSGDINFRFSSRTSAIEGIRGHQRLQRQRGEDYVAEKEVSAVVEHDGIVLQIGGRADGYYPASDPMVVEEIKTMRADANMMPDSVRQLHLGQARIYAYLLARQERKTVCVIRLCYLQLDDDSEVRFEETLTIEDLETFYDSVVGRYIAWLTRLSAWHQERDTTVEDLTFPYATYRPGQRELAVSVYKAMKDESELVLQAPTGIGKTMATLFPAVKALRELDYDKVFFLTAKTSGQEMARRAVSEMKASGLKLRDITLTAKDRVCLTPGAPCDPDHCQYAAGYYDRLPAVVANESQKQRSLDRESIEEIAKENQLCPFELSLDLSRISDVIICDYNYAFDPNVYLRRYFEESGGRYAFLIDESHNLVDRGRDMFSASICKEAYLEMKRAVGDQLPLIAKRLKGVNAAILALRKTDKAHFDEKGFIRFDEVGNGLTSALRRFCEAADEWLAMNQPASFQESLLTLYFDSLRFLRTVEMFDENYAFLMMKEHGNTHVRLNNLNPSPGLARGLARSSASVCFSATMTPQVYFQKMLGADEAAGWYKIPSPFAAEHLGVFIAPFVSTAWRDRDATLYELVDLIADAVSGREGNYLVFFPSYAYLNRVFEKFHERYPRFECICQSPGMDIDERDEFLARFAETETSTLVGFAVMGGVFGEGIDLKGTRLIGVIIAGVGLPQLGVERDLIRDYFDEVDGRGYEFAYQHPGINRVLQTAGRVIRTETDRGIVCLVDRRFGESRYRQLLPAEWRVQQVANRAALAEGIKAFWSGQAG